MSCWVVPTLAAELWGVPVEYVLGQINAGTLVSKTDYGFVLVDVAPLSVPYASPAAPLPTALPTATISTLADAEIAPIAEPAEPVLAHDVASLNAIYLSDSDPSLEELLALGAPPAAALPASPNREPAAVIDMASPAVAIEPARVAPLRSRLTASPQRAIRRSRTALPREITPAAVDEGDEEMGPDPNHGEADDGKPLDWRQARSRVALTRRRPPTRFD